MRIVNVYLTIWSRRTRRSCRIWTISVWYLSMPLKDRFCEFLSIIMEMNKKDLKDYKTQKKKQVHLVKFKYICVNNWKYIWIPLCGSKRTLSIWSRFHYTKLQKTKWVHKLKIKYLVSVTSVIPKFSEPIFR